MRKRRRLLLEALVHGMRWGLAASIAAGTRDGGVHQHETLRIFHRQRRSIDWSIGV